MPLSKAEMANVERLRRNLLFEINSFGGLFTKDRNRGNHGRTTQETGGTLPGWKRYDVHKAVLTRIARVANEMKALFEEDVAWKARVKSEEREEESSPDENSPDPGPDTAGSTGRKDPVPDTAGSAGVAMDITTDEHDAAVLMEVTEYAVRKAVGEVFETMPNLHEEGDFWNFIPTLMKLSDIYRKYYSPVMPVSLQEFSNRVSRLVHLMVKQRQILVRLSGDQDERAVKTEG
jgi:hypothetical protein